MGVRLIESARSSQSSHPSQPISFLAIPPLPGSLLPACFKQSPAPGRGRRQRTNGLRLRAGCRFACSPSCRAALSLPLARYCRPVIGLLVIASPMPSPPFHPPPASSSSVPPIESIPPRRHHHASAHVPIPVNRSPRSPSPTARLLASSSSLPSITPAGHAPPRLSPRLSCRTTGREYEPAAGCSDVVALLAFPMPLPHLGRFGPLPSLPVISCGLAASHVPTAGAFGAVRSLRLLPRWSVLIVF